MKVMLQNILKPLRIDHWIKNLVLILGIIFAIFYTENEIYNFKNSILSFLILCLSASSNYWINEYYDRHTDKFHPIKKMRTFAKSEVKKRNSNNIFFQYLILISLSIVFSYFINKSFFLLNLTFIFCGILYNLKPIRVKDVFILDVILEAINNPIRFLMGWVVILPDYYPPISIILFFWFAGCFLMTMKRYSEYLFLSKFINPRKYRKSFELYNEKNLFDISIFYCLLSLSFFIIFVIKYKIELILILPLAILMYVRIFKISLNKDSLIMRVEKIYKDKLFLYLFILGVLVSLILIKLDINFLKIFLKRELFLF